jgi:hypothetical protein
MTAPTIHRLKNRTCPIGVRAFFSRYAFTVLKSGTKSTQQTKHLSHKKAQNAQKVSLNFKRFNLSKLQSF